MMRFCGAGATGVLRAFGLDSSVAPMLAADLVPTYLTNDREQTLTDNYGSESYAVRETSATG